MADMASDLRTPPMKIRCIGIGHKYQTGKDTVAKMFRDFLESRGIKTHILAFSTPLKRALLYLFPTIDFTIDEMGEERAKNSMLPGVSRGYVSVEELLSAMIESNDDLPARDIVSRLSKYLGMSEEELRHTIDSVCWLFMLAVKRKRITTVGQALQLFGTDYIRKMVDDDFWIAVLSVCRHPGNVLIIPDMRFPNEAAFVRSIGGITVRVRRNVDYSKSTRDPTHISEIALDNYPFQIDIDNNHTLEHTSKQVHGVGSTLLAEASRPT